MRQRRVTADSTDTGGGTFPPYLLGVAILFWGWQNQVLEFAMPMAALYESAPWVRWRWRFDAADFNRLVDLTAVLFVGMAVYQFDARSVHGVYGILEWIPALLFVLLVGQRYSERGRIGLGALFLSIRRAVARGEMANERSIDFAYPYFCACLLSGVGGVVRGDWMLPLLMALIGIGLAFGRARRFHFGVWVCALGVALSIGYAGQMGIHTARQALEPFMMDLMREYMVSRRDPFRTQTAIGEIGRLKASQRIEMRIWPQGSTRMPTLLRQGVFRIYSRGTWLVGQQDVAVLRPTDGGLTWTFGDPPAPGRAASLRISKYLARGRGVLAMPDGAWQLRELGVETLERYEFGALRIKRGPDLVHYLVNYDPQGARLPDADEIDLRLPKAHKGLFGDLATELGATNLTPRQRVAAVIRHFASDFSYSLAGDPRHRDAPLKTFMSTTRTGHCEYFATATVLALRAAGVPARYATGYSVSEWSELDDSFVVRRRHAHSWAVALVNGVWMDVDTTPGRWLSEESAGLPWWKNIYDIGAWLNHIYSKWRWRSDEDDSMPWLVIAVIPLAIILIWRLRGQRVDTRVKASKPPPDFPGVDSPLLVVANHLSAAGSAPRAGESLPAWLYRLAQEGQLDARGPLLDEAIALHERLRFDARGISTAQRHRLKEICTPWVQNLKDA
jgi:protein-glutamine gamma-glutamyltransferase